LIIHRFGEKQRVLSGIPFSRFLLLLQLQVSLLQIIPLWTPFLTILFFGMFFLGGSAGSTSGGVKVMRHMIMIKNGVMEFKRTLHPNAILPVRFNGKAVRNEIVFNILGFFILYMLFFIIGAMVLASLGLDFPLP
jgi:trk system potassium uptake protein